MPTTSTSRRLLALAAALGLVLGCSSDPRIIQTNPPGFRKDVFQQEAAPKIDVLWVIDNSGSMADEQQELSVSLKRFMDLFSRGQVDYRIAVTTTDVLNDQGAFVGNPSVITPTGSDPVAAFQRNVKVGTGGKGNEQGLEAARLAIVREKANADQLTEKRRTCDAGCKTGNIQQCLDDCAARNDPPFMRPGAHLYVVFVSDEDDHSFGEIRYFQRTFETAMGVGNEGAVSVASICGDVPTPPCAALPGARYVELTALTGGITGSICDARFDTQLERMALNAAGLKRKFVLARKPDPATLDVLVNYRCDTVKTQMGRCEAMREDCEGKGPEALGVACVSPYGLPNGWTYEASTNSLFFNGDAQPGLRSVIEVSYQEETAVAK